MNATLPRRLFHIIIQQKLTQQCKAIIFQEKKNKNLCLLIHVEYCQQYNLACVWPVSWPGDHQVHFLPPFALWPQISVSV